MKKKFTLLTIVILNVMTVNAQWNLTGNSGTNPPTNFLGTTDAKNLVFKVNGSLSGIIDIGRASTSFGFKSLFSNTGFYNSAFGDSTLFSNTSGSNNTAGGAYGLLNNSSGSNNTAFGTYALQHNTTANSNTAFGYAALTTNSSGHENLAVGNSALYSNTSGVGNSAMGGGALYYNSTGYYNTASGYQALGSNTTGLYNTSSGYNSLFSNISGNTNVSNGYNALHSNTTGYSNVAIGVAALYSNSTGNNFVAVGDSAMYTLNGGFGYNTAVGSKALYSNVTGAFNTAMGYLALFSSTGTDNTSVGFGAGGSLTSGSQNTAIGSEAFDGITSGGHNTAIGYNALAVNSSGDYMTALGVEANVNASNLTNITSVGYQAICSASNTVSIGNNNITSIGGKVGWTTLSDGRVKRNIKTNIPGLLFIMKLKPVSYNFDLDAVDRIIQRPIVKTKDGKVIQPAESELLAKKQKEQINYTGFIAQDVERSAKEIGYDFSGVDVPKNDKDLYGLRYSEFVVPLVKAVQELATLNDKKDSTISTLNTKVEKLESQMAIILQQFNDLKSAQDACCFNALNQSQATGQQTDVARLEQNVPNPYHNNTVIKYYLPAEVTSAQIKVTDVSGHLLKSVSLMNNKGMGQITIASNELAAGNYFYTLIINGKNIATKQMLLTR